MVGMAAWRDGKKIEQSNSPAACEKVESVKKKIYIQVITLQ